MSFQPARVLFADVEQWATTYLRAALATRSEPYADGVWVDNKRPTEAASPYPARVVAVRRDGGPQRGLFDYPRLTVRVWADDEAECSDLAYLARALLVASPGSGPVVAAASISGPLGIADGGLQHQKYLSVELTIRASSDL